MKIQFSMKRILLATAVFAVMLVLGSKVYEWYYAVPTIPLADAVASFNARYRDDSVGKYEPPLSEEEIVASIQSQLPSLAASPQVKSIYSEIARTRNVPEDASLDAMPGWILANGAHYTVWWINLNVWAGKNSGYGLRIRENNAPKAKPQDEPVLNLSNRSWIPQPSQ